MDKIKIFGERNTGTNYLTNLFYKNINVKIIRGTVPRKNILNYNEFTKNIYFQITKNRNLGWKHAFVDKDFLSRHAQFSNTCFVFLVKNPYSYLLSLYRKTYHFVDKKPDTFKEFLQHKWKLQLRDNMKERFLNSPVDLWNKKVSSYFECKWEFPDNVVIVCYEDLLRDPDATISDIANNFALEATESFNNVLKSTKKEEKTFTYYQDYYLNERWRDNINKEDINLINNSLDFGLMEKLDYQII